MQKIDLEKDKEMIYEIENKLNLSLENLAFIFSLYLYRNTIIEDYHAKSVVCNRQLYRNIHSAVTRKYNTLSNMRYLLDILESEHPLYNLLILIENGTVSELKEIKAIQEITYYLNWKNDWDIPYVLDIDILDNKVSFILAGKFKEACNNNWILNDESMCIINKDVCNRIYTLLSKEYLINK